MAAGGIRSNRKSGTANLVGYIKGDNEGRVPNALLKPAILSNEVGTTVTDIALFRRVGTVIHGIIDQYTGEEFSIKEDTLVTDTHVANYPELYFKLGGKHYKRHFTGAANVRWFGAKGNGASDDTAALQKAINGCAEARIKLSLVEGTYLVTQTIVGKSNLHLDGMGTHSKIKGNNIVGAVFSTHPLTDSSTVRDLRITNINVCGTGTTAFVFTHCTNSFLDNILLEGFTGKDGFFFSSSWTNAFGSLYTNGAIISDSCFVIGKVFLDATFELVYTSNFSKYNVLMDSSLTSYSNNTWQGWGTINFNNVTLQGADRIGMWLRKCKEISFNTVYTENVKNLIRLGDSARDTASASTLEITFNNLSIAGDRGINTEYSIFFDNCVGIVCNNLRVLSDVVYAKAYGCYIQGARVGTGTTSDFPSYVKRHTSALSDAGLNIKYVGPMGASYELVRAADYSYHHRKLWYDTTGAMNSERITPTTKNVTLSYAD